MPRASESYGRLADKVRMEFKIFKVSVYVPTE